MSQISYFWNGNVTGDATSAPYDADSVFAAVMSTLSRCQNYPNQGYIMDSANALNRLAPTYAGGGIVNIDTGTAVVIGTWYSSNSVVGFTIPHFPPASATRIDRIVLRKDWAAQTVRLLYVEGTPTTGGGAEPALSNAYGTTWDFPICAVSITTGGAVTITDERVLSAGGVRGGTVFVPSDPASLPSTHYNADPGVGTYVTLTGVPTNATAAVITYVKSSGTFSLFIIASAGGLGTTTVYEITGNPTEIRPPPIIIPIDPIASPSQIVLANAGGSIDIFFYLVGYYVPL